MSQSRLAEGIFIPKRYTRESKDYVVLPVVQTWGDLRAV